MGSFSIWHWIVVLVIVVLIFGTKKLRNMGSDVGGAVKNFKDAMKEEGATGKITDDAKGETVEAEVTEKTKSH